MQPMNPSDALVSPITHYVILGAITTILILRIELIHGGDADRKEVSLLKDK